MTNTSKQLTTLSSQIQSALKSYTPSSFKIIHSIPHPLPHSNPPPTSTLLILDSSFNPPTRAHAYLIQQAITRLQKSKSHNNVSPSKGRILLLLSTKNADKPSAPASTQDRVCMMALFAQDLWDQSLASSPETTDTIEPCISGIDIALSTQPRFLEKSVFLATSSEENPYTEALSVDQWHLLGFDTLIRLLDGKYYDGGELGVLRPLFEGRNRVLVVRRGGDGEQEEFVRKLSLGREEGGFDGKGWEEEWGGKVELVDGFDGVRDVGEVVSVSSTAVRTAVKEAKEGVVGKMCAGMVTEFIVANGLYKD